jgi:DNA-binding beta-propeller fold protein YncE
MFDHTSLLKIRKTLVTAINFSGDGWKVDNADGVDFISNLSGIFNNNRVLERIIIPISLPKTFNQPSPGIIIADGNFICLIPSGNNRLHFYETNSGSIFQSQANDPAPNGNWKGGTLSNNDEAYCTPGSDTRILKVSLFADVNPGPYSVFGDAGTGTDKWYGAVKAQNGKIYSIPFNSTNVLVVDPVTNTISNFGSLPAGGQKWRGGCLSPINGKIYGMPYDSDTVLVIDPSNDSVSTLGPIPPVGATSGRFAGCAIGTNGKLYAIPYNASTVLVIDTQDDSLSTLGSFSSDAGKWEGGALGIDGKIYAAPYNSPSILAIDPLFETVETFGSLGAGGGKWRNPALGRDGRIYMTPAGNLNILALGQGGYGITRDITQSRYLNKF